jgi:hypothetical protein
MAEKPEPKTRNYLLRQIDPDIWRALKCAAQEDDAASAD